MLDPETGLIIFVIGGIGTVGSFMAYKVAQDIGPKLQFGDMLPAPPPYPPLPRFLFTHPELVEELQKS